MSGSCYSTRSWGMWRMQYLWSGDGEVLVPCQTCLKRSHIDQCLIMIRQKFEESKKLWVFLWPSQTPQHCLPASLQETPASSSSFTPTCSSCFSLGPSPRSLPKNKISVPNNSLPVVLFFSNLLLTMTRFLTLCSISAAEKCFIIPFYFCIRKRLQYTEWSLRGMYEARQLMKAGTIGSWFFLSKRMNLGRASIWELNYFTPTWNLYNCKAKTEHLLDHI